MENYWFYLFPETFLFIDKGKLLFYHSKNFTYFEVDFDSFINDLYTSLIDINNFYCAPVSKDNFLKYSDFINNIKSLCFGDCVQSSIQERPISFPPICKINKNVSTIRGDFENNRAGYIIEYFRDLTIYLTKDEDGSSTYYKQAIYPIKGKDRITQQDLLQFMDYLKGISIDINIVCDPILLQEYEYLFHHLNKHKHTISLYILNSKLSQNAQVSQIPENFSVYIICDGDEEPVRHCSFSYLFLITNEAEYAHAQEQASNIENVEILPIYTGSNIDFFRKYVFTSKDELFSLKLTKREIFAKQQLNSNFFGKLTILPDGNVYANINSTPLGTIKESLYEVIFKALDGDDSWMMTRDKVEPCAQCRFKFLCAPISNYEFVIGKYNLCHLESKVFS